jgi:peptidoglycan/xylan/chitin deacetylase (PgdA/CDA1 family)
MLSSAKQMMLMATRGPLFEGLVTQLEKLDSDHPSMLRILAYHRVDELQARPDFDPALLSTTPAEFRAQAKYLKEHYNVVSMDRVLNALKGASPLPDRSVLMTFDDAYQDFADHAWPVLRSLGLPVTLFVPTAFPDHPERSFWWDRLYNAFRSTPRRDEINAPFGRLSLGSPAQRFQSHKRAKDHVKSLPHFEAMSVVDQICRELEAPVQNNAVLGWDALRRLAGEGVTLGSHTRNHPLLNRIDPESAYAEVSGSLSDLKREIGSAPPVFAYPSGGYDEAAVAELRRLDIGVAVTTDAGIDDLNSADRLRLRRINVGKRTSLALFRFRLLPLAWKLWAGAGVR